MSRITALLLGFWVAAIVPALWFAILTFVSIGANGIASMLFWFFIAYCYSLLATLLFGAPIFLLLYRFKRIYWWTALLTGVFVGAIVASILAFSQSPMLSNFLNMCSIGAASGAVFWLIWRQGVEQE